MLLRASRTPSAFIERKTRQPTIRRANTSICFNSQFSRCNYFCNVFSLLVRPARSQRSAFAWRSYQRSVSCVRPIMDDTVLNCRPLRVVFVLCLPHQTLGPFPDPRGIAFRYFHNFITSKKRSLRENWGGPGFSNAT